MKNKINALLLSDLKIIIPNEQPRYLIEKNDNGNYIIKPIPIIYKGNIRNILDSLAYDFDSLKADVYKRQIICSLIHLSYLLLFPYRCV